MDTTNLFAAPVNAASFPLGPRACANCKAPRMGEYCYQCGQHFLEGRLTIRRLVRDFLVRKLGLEGGLLRTVVDLTIRPATMIRDYVNGRRQRYTNPVAYLLLVAGLYVLLSRTWMNAMAEGLRSDNAGWEGAEAESFVQVQLFMEGHPSLTTVILCLFLVPALRVLFRGTTTTAESSVFALFVSGHLLLMQIVINLGALMLSADVYRAMTGRVTGVPTLLLLFSAGRFFGTRFSSHLKVAVALALALFGILMAMVLAMLVVSAAAAVPTAALS